MLSHLLLGWYSFKINVLTIFKLILSQWITLFQYETIIIILFSKLCCNFVFIVPLKKSDCVKKSEEEEWSRINYFFSVPLRFTFLPVLTTQSVYIHFYLFSHDNITCSCQMCSNRCLWLLKDTDRTAWKKKIQLFKNSGSQLWVMLPGKPQRPAKEVTESSQITYCQIQCIEL